MEPASPLLTRTGHQGHASLLRFSETLKSEKLHLRGAPWRPSSSMPTAGQGTQSQATVAFLRFVGCVCVQVTMCTRKGRGPFPRPSLCATSHQPCLLLWCHLRFAAGVPRRPPVKRAGLPISQAEEANVGIPGGGSPRKEALHRCVSAALCASSHRGAPSQCVCLAT